MVVAQVSADLDTGVCSMFIANSSGKREVDR